MKVYLIATQMIYYFTFIPWIIIWGVTFFAIQQAPTNQLLFLFMFITLYPVSVIVCSIFAWFLHLNKKGVAITINVIPAIWLIIYYLYF